MISKLPGILLISLISLNILASHIDGEVQSDPNPSGNIKTAADIALQNCKKYAEYRYVNKWKNSTSAGQKGSWQKEMDCINAIPLITGGIIAEPKEYPHMALIGFGKDFKNVEWSEAGSLISEKFVLTVTSGIDPQIRDPAKWVLLGETNISSKIDHGNGVVYEISKRHVHPNYSNKTLSHDISLLELNSTVAMSPYIRPACLYTSTNIPTNAKASITGWGRTGIVEERSENLLKATIAVAADSKCIERYEKKFDSKTMICAGDLTEGKDTCSGDSGAPLQIPVDNEVCMWNILGLSSFGPSICGNREDHGVYTRVPYYLNWIQSIVWPA